MGYFKKNLPNGSVLCVSHDQVAPQAPRVVPDLLPDLHPPTVAGLVVVLLETIQDFDRTATDQTACTESDVNNSEF